MQENQEIQIPENAISDTIKAMHPNTSEGQKKNQALLAPWLFGKVEPYENNEAIIKLRRG